MSPGKLGWLNMSLRTLRPSWEGGAGDPQVKGAAQGGIPTPPAPPPWRLLQEIGEARLPRELTMDSSGTGLCPGRAGLDRGNIAGCTSQKVGGANWRTIWTQLGEPHSVGQCLEPSRLGPEKGSRLKGPLG